MKTIKTRTSNVASHQLRRLQLIQNLQRGFLTAGTDELESEITLGKLLANCDHEARLHDTGPEYAALRGDAVQSLQNAGVSVSEHRFLLPDGSRNILGTTMFLSDIPGKDEQGKAVVHLMANPEKDGQGWLHTCTLYRVPSIENGTPVNAITLLPRMQGFLRDLGYTATLVRSRPRVLSAIDLDSFIEYDETVAEGLRFVDLKPSATREIANQIRDRLGVEAASAKVVNTRGRYTISVENK